MAKQKTSEGSYDMMRLKRVIDILHSCIKLQGSIFYYGELILPGTT